MAADLGFKATVDALIDFGDVVALIGALDWPSFVDGYRAYDAWYADDARGALTATPRNGRVHVSARMRVA